MTIRDRPLETPPSRPYTVNEAAKVLRCSTHHIYRRCEDGSLPHTRLGRKILIPSRIVHVLLEGEA